jgi:hypothetical protein
MSHNISIWRTKKLVDLEVPLSAIHSAYNEENWLRVQLLPEDKVAIHCRVEAFEMEGKLIDGTVLVSNLHCMGTGSGWFLDELKALLSQSSGELIASLVWECGNYLSRLVVVNGDVSEEPIEI